MNIGVVQGLDGVIGSYKKSRIFLESHWDYMWIYGGYTAGITVYLDPAKPLHFTKMVDISPAGWIPWGAGCVKA